MSTPDFNKNVPSPQKTDGGNHLLSVAGAALATGMLYHSGTGSTLIESGEHTVPVSGVHKFSVDLSKLEGEDIDLSSGASAFFKTYAWIKGDSPFRYSTHKSDIFGAGKHGYFPVAADKDEAIPVQDLNQIYICGQASGVRIYFKVFTVKSKFNRLKSV